MNKIKDFGQFLNEADTADAEKYFTDEVEGSGYSVDEYSQGAWRRIFFFLLKEGFTKEEADEIMKSKHTRWCRDHARNEGKSAHTLSTFNDWLAYYNYKGRNGKEFFKKEMAGPNW